MTTAASTSLSTAAPRKRWATASHAEATATLPGELTALGEHVDHCNGSRGRWFALQCAADSAVSFVASRFVTTAVVVALVFGIASIVA